MPPKKFIKSGPTRSVQKVKPKDDCMSGSEDDGLGISSAVVKWEPKQPNTNGDEDFSDDENDDKYGNADNALSTTSSMQCAEMWENGETIRVRFLSAPPDGTKSSIIENVRRFEQFANIHFEFVKNDPSDIRISFDTNLRCWTCIGTAARAIEAPAPTMNLPITSDVRVSDIRRLVLYEFKHALGCFHVPSGSLELRPSGSNNLQPTRSSSLSPEFAGFDTQLSEAEKLFIKRVYPMDKKESKPKPRPKSEPMSNHRTRTGSQSKLEPESNPRLRPQDSSSGDERQSNRAADSYRQTTPAQYQQYPPAQHSQSLPPQHNQYHQSQPYSNPPAQYQQPLPQHQHPQPQNQQYGSTQYHQAPQPQHQQQYPQAHGQYQQPSQQYPQSYTPAPANNQQIIPAYNQQYRNSQFYQQNSAAGYQWLLLQQQQQQANNNPVVINYNVNVLNLNHQNQQVQQRHRPPRPPRPHHHYHQPCQPFILYGPPMHCYFR
ncbi:hypothetical protein DRE_02819 [Drechslerella stenobrocha 248]|uniref:Uncharacterized protein n=1 Tax=Drechslerella stenobrocha 248 TaxID=1043628 RepID=W7I637_9PEZI|nr:hypothetical protein DRE_02819 [Drechslerella stenobrocha 248]